MQLPWGEIHNYQEFSDSMPFVSDLLITSIEKATVYIDNIYNGNTDKEIEKDPLEINLKCTWDSDYFYALHLMQDGELLGRYLTNGMSIAYRFWLPYYSIDTLIKLEKILGRQYMLIPSECPPELETMRNIINNSIHPIRQLTILTRSLMSAFQKLGGPSWPKVYEESELYSIIEHAKRICSKYDAAEKKKALEHSTGISVKWSSEYQLYHMTYILFPDAIFQARFNWLEAQSIDIFIPSLNVGIEYQGKQHYESVNHFGGEKKYIDNVERDNRKRELCNANGIILLEWPYSKLVRLHYYLDFLAEANLIDIPTMERAIDKIRQFDVIEHKANLYRIG